MNEALAVKCPTCAVARHESCRKLALVPGGRAMWVAAEPHPLRVAKTR